MPEQLNDETGPTSSSSDSSQSEQEISQEGSLSPTAEPTVMEKQISQLLSQVDQLQTSQQQAAQMQQQQLSQPEPIVRPDFEPLDFDSMNSAQLAGEQSRRDEAMADYHVALTDQKIGMIRQENEDQRAYEAHEREKTHIQSFKDSHPDFDDLGEQLRDVYTPALGIEKAYALAKIEKAGGLEAFAASIAGANQASVATAAPVQRSAVRASAHQPNENMAKKYDMSDPTQAAKAAFDEVLSQAGPGARESLVSNPAL